MNFVAYPTTENSEAGAMRFMEIVLDSNGRIANKGPIHVFQNDPRTGDDSLHD
jgi:hypothetical protein